MALVLAMAPVVLRSASRCHEDGWVGAFWSLNLTCRHPSLSSVEGYPIPAFTLLLVFVATMLIVSLLLLGCVYCARQYMTDLAAEEHFQRRTRARIRQVRASCRSRHRRL